MPTGPTLATFAVASLVLILLPGPAMLFLLARGIAGGRRVGAYSALGVESASAVYVAATAVGLTAVLAASGTALSVLRYAGAAYLVWLGLRTILHRHEPLVAAGPASATVGQGGARSGSGAWRSWRQGFVVGITNPKVALFFLAFFRSSWTQLPARSPRRCSFWERSSCSSVRCSTSGTASSAAWSVACWRGIRRRCRAAGSASG